MREKNGLIKYLEHIVSGTPDIEHLFEMQKSDLRHGNALGKRVRPFLHAKSTLA